MAPPVFSGPDPGMASELETGPGGSTPVSNGSMMADAPGENSDESREELKDQIFDLERILRLHFVLRKDVMDYMELLPWRIRRFKTTIMKNPETCKGPKMGTARVILSVMYRPLSVLRTVLMNRIKP